MVSTFQLVNIFLIDIAYTITAGKAMSTLALTACGWQGIAEGDCFDTVRLAWNDGVPEGIVGTPGSSRVVLREWPQNIARPLGHSWKC